MEVSDSELRNKMCCDIKFYNCLDKTTPETVELMKNANKEKCLGR